MNKGAIILVLVGMVIMFFPEIIAYAFGGFLIAIGVVMFLGTKNFKKPTQDNNYFKFGDYKIYKNNK